MGSIADNLADVRARISSACRRAGRDESDVELLAVSKTFPVDAVEEAVAAGQRLFGESRQQEAEAKIAKLPDSLRWHFIGPLQRNKVRKILPQFEMIHSIDSLRLAAYAARVAEEDGFSPRVLLEVNVAGEASKCGFSPDGLERDFESLRALGRIKICGLMMVPPAVPDPEESRRWFAAARELRDRLSERHGILLPHLSMGMSGDYEVAVEEGATLVRVGSSVFGVRPPLDAASERFSDQSK
jgi:pyridoxal phosphate enzyme (YggS family)